MDRNDRDEARREHIRSEQRREARKAYEAYDARHREIDRGFLELYAADKEVERARRRVHDTEREVPERSPREVGFDYDRVKSETIDRLLDYIPLFDSGLQSEIRQEIRRIDVDTPDACERLTALAETLARHPACVAPNELHLIRQNIRLLETLCSLYRTKVAGRAKEDPPQEAEEEPASRTSRYSTNRAVADLQRRAEQGDSDAQFALAMRLLQGAGTPKDADQGLQWLKDAAKQGHSGAAWELEGSPLRALLRRRLPPASE
jgi:hypothetical protein